MDEKKDAMTGTTRRADVDDVGQEASAAGQPRLGVDETPPEGGPVTFEVIEEAFLPLEAAVEPDRRELVAGRVDAEYAKVNGVAAVTHAKRALINGMSSVTIGEKARVTGFAPVVVSSQKAKIKKGGALLAVAGREVRAGDSAFIGVALAPRVQVEEGGKVLVTPLMAVLIGLAFGLGFGVMALAGVWMFRRSMSMFSRRRRLQKQLVRGYRDISGTVRHSLGDYADRARSMYQERVRAM